MAVTAASGSCFSIDLRRGIVTAVLRDREAMQVKMFVKYDELDGTSITRK
jgi:hypothetical protein